MNRVNKEFPLILVLVGLIVLSIATTAYLAFKGLRFYNAVVREQECTKYGCIGGITIEFTGMQESTPYEITFLYPSGETKTLKCSGVSDATQPYPEICRTQSAFISLPPGDPPEEITVTVKTSNGEWTETFKPNYRASNPNGEDCPAICYTATIQFKIPK